MKKIIIAIIGMACFAGCGLDQYVEAGKKPTPKPSNPPSHIKTLWTQNDIELVEIDGHEYLVSRIGHDCYGLRGVCSVVHSQSCPCMKKK